MQLPARKVMQSQVLSVSPETPLLDVQRLFVEEEIHGAPVVDDRGRVVGMITSADLLRAVAEEHESGSSHASYFRELVEYSSPDWGRMPDDFQDRLSELRTSDFMSSDLVTVHPEASVAEVARALRQHRIHRVLVVDDESLLGIISSFDLVGLLDREAASM